MNHWSSILTNWVKESRFRRYNPGKIKSQGTDAGDEKDAKILCDALKNGCTYTIVQLERMSGTKIFKKSVEFLKVVETVDCSLDQQRTNHRSLNWILKGTGVKVYVSRGKKIGIGNIVKRVKK